MTIRSKAPYRVSFGGGGSDVPPYCWDHGGEVISTTIDKHAHASLTPNGDAIVIRSVDLDAEARFEPGRLEYDDGDLDLIKAVINQFDIDDGFEMTVQTDLPPGSGMGGSSSVAVAVIGCLAAYTGEELSPMEVAELAYHAERVDLGQHGGYQDQYAAAVGGFNTIRFFENETTVLPVTVEADLLNELHERFTLYFTGDTHDSSAIHEVMAENYEEDTMDEKARRDRLKAVAVDMRDALADGDLASFGELLHEGWNVKKELSTRITNPVIDEIYASAREHGALGGKILGAGGGGHLLLFSEAGRTLDTRYGLRHYDVEPVPFEFEPDGVTTWSER